jgi:hypothetical protein
MKQTTDHKVIRAWADARCAAPAVVRGAYGDGVPPVLKFIVPGAHSLNKDLEAVSWEYFLAKFDLYKLIFVYQEVTSSGERSCLNEILQRETDEHERIHWH